MVIRPRSGWIAIDWRELWEARELLYFLVWRDVKVRYKQTVLGVAWAVLQPFFTMIVFTVIFGRFAKIPVRWAPVRGVRLRRPAALDLLLEQHQPGQHEPDRISSRCSTKIYLPRLFVPAASVGSGLVDLLVSFVVFAGLMLFYGVGVGPGVLAFRFWCS